MAATGSGSHAPARSLSGSRGKRYDGRLSLCDGADREPPFTSGWTAPNEPLPNRPTPRWRRRSGAPCGRCGSGAVEANLRDVRASVLRGAAPSAARSACFRWAGVMPSCSCAGRIRDGGRLLFWPKDGLIPVGQMAPCPVAPEVQRCWVPRNGRAALRSSVPCRLQQSNRTGRRMTSGNAMLKAACAEQEWAPCVSSCWLLW